MPTKITIEKIDLQRDESVKEAANLVASFADELGASLDWSTKAALPDLFRRRKANIFLARREGEAVGVMVCQKVIVTFRGSEALNIHDLFIVESARRAGIGKLLMEHATDFARSLGCVRVTLEVDSLNTKARDFYRVMGFELPEDGAQELHYICLPLD
jgi:GNAT superfamily N-acetyltransferase